MSEGHKFRVGKMEDGGVGLGEALGRKGERRVCRNQVSRIWFWFKNGNHRFVFSFILRLLHSFTFFWSCNGSEFFFFFLLEGGEGLIYLISTCHFNLQESITPRLYTAGRRGKWL